MEPYTRCFELITNDKEIAAIQIFLETLEDLDDQQRARVLNYAVSWATDPKHVKTQGLATKAIEGPKEEI